jgi:hypothetical protein
MVRSALLEDIPKTLGVTPTVGEIHINPFLLQAEVKDFSLAAQGEKLLGFKRLFIDFELSSIWHRAYSFGSIELTAPEVNAKVARDGTLNLLELRPKSAAPSSAAKSEPLPRVRVGILKVAQGSMRYEDRSLPTVFTAILQPVNFELRDFSTGVEGGLFTFTAASNLGERIEWHGHLSVQPIESDGEFHIDGLRAHTLWEYLEDRVNFAVNSGSIDLNATYKFSLRDTVDLQLDVSKVALSDVAVRLKGSDTDWISVPEAALSAITVDLAKRRAHVDSLSLNGLKVSAWRDPDGRLNLLQLISSPSTSPSEPHAPAQATITASNPAPPAARPWQCDLGRFEVHGASISAEDRGTRPATKVVLAPLSLVVGGASLDWAKPVSVALDTRINETGALTMKGDVTPQPAAASLSMKLTGIDLSALQPYIARYTSMTLRSGRVGADAQLRYAISKGQPAMQLAGNIRVENLHTVDNALQDDFVNWERLDVLGLNYQQAPDRLDIAEVVVRKPYARLIIESDESLNVKRVLAAPGALPASAAAHPPMVKAALKSGPVKPAAATTAGTQSPKPTSTAMSIKKVTIRAGQANFTDLSIAPTFSADIQGLDGTVLGLSSKQNSRARMDLHGSVGPFSPVSIVGDVNLLSAAFYADIAMDFENIQLAIFNPYSGKFAGYNITEGKLTTQLHYKVDGRKLDAQHHVVIDRLEFGDKTPSKEAVSLPVKLAVALLKDRHGVIDLNLPVTGSLDDPNFRLAPIIWKIFVNILEKAVTAPFALLGALFGGGPEIQFIDFQPGSVAMDAAGVEKIKAVAKAMKERPQLKIEVPIAVVPEIDRPALASAKLAAEASKIEAVKLDGKKGAVGATLAPWEQLDSATKLQILTQLYTRDVGGEPKYPESISTLKQKSDATAAKIEFLSQGIREHVVVGDEDLKTLGEQRALAVQQQLLTGTQIEPERVFLVANDKATGKDGLVRLELSLR